jgi:hypothetical protein
VGEDPCHESNNTASLLHLWASVEQRDSDGYSLQVKFVAQSPEMVWAHGSYLRKVIPVIGVEMPTSQK